MIVNLEGLVKWQSGQRRSDFEQKQGFFSLPQFLDWFWSLSTFLVSGDKETIANPNTRTLTAWSRDLLGNVWGPQLAKGFSFQNTLSSFGSPPITFPPPQPLSPGLKRPCRVSTAWQSTFTLPLNGRVAWHSRSVPCHPLPPLYRFEKAMLFEDTTAIMETLFVASVVIV